MAAHFPLIVNGECDCGSWGCWKFGAYITEPEYSACRAQTTEEWIFYTVQPEYLCIPFWYDGQPFGFGSGANGCSFPCGHDYRVGDVWGSFGYAELYGEHLASIYELMSIHESEAACGAACEESI